MSNEEGRYIYGITTINQRQEVGPIGIGKKSKIVYTLPYQDISAIISNSPIVKYPVSRDNTVAHAAVLEKVGKEHTVLPVRFCTIAESEEAIIERALKDRYQEFYDLLKEMTGKIELGVRARWIDLNAIFAEIVEENSNIKELKEASLNEKDTQKAYASKIKVGQLVQEALTEKRKGEAKELLDALRPLSLDCKENSFYGDMNILNAAFLVAKEKERDFDQKMDELDVKYRGRTKLKYISSIVPYNFVEIVINL